MNEALACSVVIVSKVNVREKNTIIQTSTKDAILFKIFDSSLETSKPLRHPIYKTKQNFLGTIHFNLAKLINHIL